MITKGFHDIPMLHCFLHFYINVIVYWTLQYSLKRLNDVLTFPAVVILMKTDEQVWEKELQEWKEKRWTRGLNNAANKGRDFEMCWK